MKKEGGGPWLASVAERQSSKFIQREALVSKLLNDTYLNIFYPQLLESMKSKLNPEGWLPLTWGGKGACQVSLVTGVCSLNSHKGVRKGLTL